jgi:isopenicillin N synthase-like dioxygenase
MSEVDVGSGSIIPIIDITESNQSDLIIQACLTHGFFYVDNRRGQLMDVKTMHRIMELGSQFFALPSSVKQKYGVTRSKHHRGYVDGSTIAPYGLKLRSDADSRTVTRNANESMLFGSNSLLRDPQMNVNIKPNPSSHTSNCSDSHSSAAGTTGPGSNENTYVNEISSEGTSGYGNDKGDEAESAVADLEDGNFYPEEMGEEFKILVQSYFKNAAAIGHKVLEHLQDHLDLDKTRRISSSTVRNGDCNGSSDGTTKIQHWSEVLRSNLFASRFFLYPAGESSLLPHTDISVLTVLCQNQYGGLQIFYGDKWIDVKPIENTFLINVGNMLQEWSNGKLTSTLHQVMNRGLNNRQSFAYFMFMDKDCEIYMEQQKKWANHYRYVIQKYYDLIPYMSENVKHDSSSPCFDGKNAKEIDQIHQETIQRMRSKLRRIANSSSSSSAAVTSATIVQ